MNGHKELPFVCPTLAAPGLLLVFRIKARHPLCQVLWHSRQVRETRTRRRLSHFRLLLSWPKQGKQIAKSYSVPKTLQFARSLAAPLFFDDHAL